MEISKTQTADAIKLTISGRLDSLTCVQLSNEIDSIKKEGNFNLIFDFETLEYISSAGLRVLLTTQKHANSSGTRLELKNINDTVKEVLDMTGFSRILNIVK
ncbi:MAG: STAS domain-containing protein [Proteobacteria bacterium]|nr:STAS domain-containing protein [Pseudomonadota bacterium]